jgi:hypothetical protein
MNKNTIIAISTVVLLAAGAGGYYYWQSQQAVPDTAQTEAPASLQEDTMPQFPLKTDISPEQPPLPLLNESDAFVTEALNTLLANPELAEVFINEKLVQNIVATIDNLPSKNLPLEIMPIQTAEGSFITSGTGKNLTISADNAARYLPYMNVVNTVDSKKLVQLYVRLYPLFQQAYADMGYPNKYFNDRLMFVIDDLLAAPDVQEPVKLVQPLVVYEYADRTLEQRDIGQRIMMRIGSANEARLKAKLKEIRQELLNNAQQTKQ